MWRPLVVSPTLAPLFCSRRWTLLLFCSPRKIRGLDIIVPSLLTQQSEDDPSRSLCSSSATAQTPNHPESVPIVGLDVVLRNEVGDGTLSLGRRPRVRLCRRTGWLPPPPHSAFAFATGALARARSLPSTPGGVRGPNLFQARVASSSASCGGGRLVWIRLHSSRSNSLSIGHPYNCLHILCRYLSPSLANGGGRRHSIVVGLCIRNGGSRRTEMLSSRSSFRSACCSPSTVRAPRVSPHVRVRPARHGPLGRSAGEFVRLSVNP